MNLKSCLKILTIIIISNIPFSLEIKENSKNILLSDNVFITSHGVVFQNLGKVNIVTASHNLVISIDNNEIITSMDNLREIMNQILNLVKMQEHHYFNTYFITLLSNVINETNTKFNKFKGYFDTFNEKITFPTNINNNDNSKPIDTYSSEDNDNINTHVNNKYNHKIDLHNELDKIIQKIDNYDDDDDDDDEKRKDVNFIDAYISKVNIATLKMSKISKAIYSANVTARALYLHYTNNSHTLYNMTRENALINSINFLEISLINFNEEIDQLLYKLDSILTTRKTSVSIITPKYFIKVLQELQNRVKLLYPPTENFISEYYSISKSFVKKKDNKLYFIIEIPIKSDYEYNLYKLHFIWVPIYNLNGWARKFSYENKKYLAISDNHGEYILLDDLEDSMSIIYIPSKEVKKTESTYIQDDCLLSLLNEKSIIENEKNCVFIYEFNRDSEFIRIENFWIGSILTDNIHINKLCNQVLKVQKKRTSMNINRSIIKIPISHNCSYISDNFVIPKFESIYNFNDNKYNSKNIEILLNPINVTLPQSIKSLFLYKKTRYISTDDINMFSAYLEQNFPINSYINFGLFIIIFIYIVILSIFFLIYLKCWDQKLMKRQNQELIIEQMPNESSNLIQQPYMTTSSSSQPPLSPPPPPPLQSQFHNSNTIKFGFSSNNNKEKSSNPEIVYDEYNYISMK